MTGSRGSPVGRSRPTPQIGSHSTGRRQDCANDQDHAAQHQGDDASHLMFQPIAMRHRASATRQVPGPNGLQMHRRRTTRSAASASESGRALLRPSFEGREPRSVPHLLTRRRQLHNGSARPTHSLFLCSTRAGRVPERRTYGDLGLWALSADSTCAQAAVRRPARGGRSCVGPSGFLAVGLSCFRAAW